MKLIFTTGVNAWPKKEIMLENKHSYKNKWFSTIRLRTFEIHNGCQVGFENDCYMIEFFFFNYQL